MHYNEGLIWLRNQIDWISWTFGFGVKYFPAIPCSICIYVFLIWWELRMVFKCEIIQLFTRSGLNSNYLSIHSNIKMWSLMTNVDTEKDSKRKTSGSCFSMGEWKFTKFDYISFPTHFSSNFIHSTNGKFNGVEGSARFWFSQIPITPSHLPTVYVHCTYLVESIIFVEFPLKRMNWMKTKCNFSYYVRFYFHTVIK